MNTLFSKIIALMLVEAYDSDWYRISAYILENISHPQNLSTQKITEACYVSSGTVLKYCRSMGYQNFSAFKKELLSTLETRKRQLANRYPASLYMRDKPIEEQVIHALSLSSFSLEINRLKNALASLADAILEAGSLHILAATFPLALSMQFAEDCSSLGIPVFLHQTEEPLENKHFPVGLLVSFSGRWMESGRASFEKARQHFDQGIICSCNDYHFPGNHILLPKEIGSSIPNGNYLKILDLLFLNIQNRLKT